MTATASIRATGRRAPAGHWLPWLLGAATVALEIGYPLVSGRTRDLLTMVTVGVFFLASSAHALAWRGLRWTAVLIALTAGGGFLVEAVGTRTGQPFGHYSYAGTLGARLAGVPLVIPLAWTMMAYPALLAARRLTASATARALVGGWALASWDLFLDPQMVDAGHWRWSLIGAALPGVSDVPLSNFVGWVLAAVVLMAALGRLLPDRRPRAATDPDPMSGPAGARSSRSRDLDHPGATSDDRVPHALYLWTWASSVLANLAFFGRPAVAAWGGLGMGLVAVPLALVLRRRR